MANPNPFEKIKIFNYVQTLSKCCKDKEQTTFKLANKDKVDLIVMGTKGRSGFFDILIGSVAQRISGSAKQPVLLVK